MNIFAVMDEELVWHGGMNLLGKEDVWDNLIRIKSAVVAEELLELSFGISSFKLTVSIRCFRIFVDNDNCLN